MLIIQQNCYAAVCYVYRW